MKSVFSRANDVSWQTHRQRRYNIRLHERQRLGRADSCQTMYDRAQRRERISLCTLLNAAYCRDLARPPNREEAENRPRRCQRRHGVHRAVFFGSFGLLTLLLALSSREEDRRKHEEGPFVRSEQITPSDYQFRDRSGRFDLWLPLKKTCGIRMEHLSRPRTPITRTNSNGGNLRKSTGRLASLLGFAGA